MGPRIILLTSLLFAAGICDAGATAITLDPTARGTLMSHFGDSQIYIRGGPGGNGGSCGGQPLPCDFIMDGDSEMRMITEFDLSGQDPARGHMYLEAYIKDWEQGSCCFGHITLHAYSGNGTLETSDYYRTDFPLFAFNGPGPSHQWVSYSIDITDVYNTFIQNGDPYLGFVWSRTEPELPRYAVAGPKLSNTPLAPWSPPPVHVRVADGGSTLLLLGVALTGLAGVRPKRSS